MGASERAAGPGVEVKNVGASRARGSGGTLVAVLGAVSLALVLLAPTLGIGPLDDPGEGQQAEIAREMQVSRDWITLRLNGVRYFDKPPLLYWLVASAFTVFGVEEWAARLPALAGAILATAATVVLGARLMGPGWGLAAACALLSSVLFFAYGRYVRPETLFVAGVQWGLTGLILGLEDGLNARDRRRWLLVGAVGLGLASLAKDPLGLIGPLVAVVAGLALTGRIAFARLPWRAVAALLVLGFGWYALTAALNPGFAWYAVVDNHLLNLLRLRRFPDEDVPLTSLEFLAVAILGAFPWTVGAGLQVIALVRRRAWRQPAEAAWVILAVWALGVVALFAIAPFKLPQYALPAYPAVALLAARLWREQAPGARALVAAHLACFGALAAGAAIAAASHGRLFTETVFSVVDVYTRKEAVVGQESPLPSWPLLAPLLTRAALVFGAGSLGLAWALARRAGRVALGIVLATMLGLMPMVSAGAALVASGRSVAGLGMDLRRAMGPGDVLVHEGPIENSGALALYSGRLPLLLDGQRSVLGFGATLPDGRVAFWELPDLVRAWSGDRRVLLVTTRAPDKTLVTRLPPDRVHLLRARNGRWLYSNVATPIP